MLERKLSTLRKEKIKARVLRLRSYGAPVTAARGYDLRRVHLWTPQRLAAVTRFENELFDFMDAMPVTGMLRVHVRNKRLKKAIQETVYKEAVKPKWVKGEFVPNYGSEKIKLSVDKDGNLIIADKIGKKIKFILDPLRMVTDLDNYMGETVDYLEGRGARVFVLKAGNHYFSAKDYDSGVKNFGAFIRAEEGARMLHGLMNQYANYEEWLHVIEGHIIEAEEYEARINAYFDTAAKLNRYDKERQKQKKKNKNTYKRIKRMLDKMDK